ncbi:MAG: Sbal_3080 family lipoprotein [Sedimenticola sp.]
MKYLILVSLVVILSGCTSLDVTSAKNIDGNEICVINNVSVKKDFTDAYIRQINENGYKSRLIDESEKNGCIITSTYAATYGFHWGVYLKTAELNVFNKNELLGKASYKAPYASPEKHGRVENKIDAMVDKLLPQL